MAEESIIMTAACTEGVIGFPWCQDSHSLSNMYPHVTLNTIQAYGLWHISAIGERGWQCHMHVQEVKRWSCNCNGVIGVRWSHSCNVVIGVRWSHNCNVVIGVRWSHNCYVVIGVRE